MALPPFAVLIAMSDEQLDKLFDSEVEKLLVDTDTDKRVRFRAMANGCKLRNQAAKNTIESMINAQKAMWESFGALNDSLQEFIGKK